MTLSPLRRQRRRAHPERARALTTKSLSGLRLLIVEDEFLIASTTTFAVAEQGAHVVGPALSVERALGYLADNVIDGALLDYEVGGQLCTAIADALQQAGIPFILVTGIRDGGIAVEVRTRPQLQKPFQESELVALCVETFDTSRRATCSYATAPRNGTIGSYGNPKFLRLRSRPADGPGLPSASPSIVAKLAVHSHGHPDGAGASP